MSVQVFMLYHRSPYFSLQVNLKTQQILELLAGLDGDLKTYAILQLSQGFIDLSEGVMFDRTTLHLYSCTDATHSAHVTSRKAQPWLTVTCLSSNCRILA